MAIRSWNQPECAGVGHREICGSFIPNGASAVATVYGVGFSVARANTGVWTVTLEEGFADFVSIDVGVQVATADTQARLVRVGDQSVANKTFDIVHLAGAAVQTNHPVAADISTSGVANKIHFRCVVAKQDVPGAGV